MEIYHEEMPAYPREYSGTDEEQCREWIEAVREAPLLDADGVDAIYMSMPELLKSGVLICEVLNKISPGSVKKISKSKMPFPQRENITAFINACSQIGVPQHENFDTNDLFEESNIKQVLVCLRSLGRLSYTIAGYDGPGWGKADNSAAPGGRAKKFEVNTGEALWGASETMAGNKQVTVNSRGVTETAPQAGETKKHPPRPRTAVCVGTWLYLAAGTWLTPAVCLVRRTRHCAPNSGPRIRR